MSENTTTENISFQETENLDDSELQSKLYAKIYYESHIAEATTTNTLKTIQFDSVTNEVSIEQDNMQAKTDTNQLLESTSIIRLTDQEISSVIQDHVNTDNDRYSGKFSTTERKENKSSQKHKSSNYITDKHSDNLELYSKYNVLQKQEKKKLIKKTDKETSDSSDSDNSIFEVPVPPKPKPPLINLQDSDEEDNLNARINENDTKLIQMLKSYKTAETTTCIPEDIALNCNSVHSLAQRGASSLNEIRQLSRSAEMEQDQEELSKTKNQNTNKNLPHDKTIKNTINCRFTLEGNSPVTKQPNTDNNNSEYNVNNCKPSDQEYLHNISIKVSCTNSNPISNRKRQFISKIDESSKEKRQCSSQHTSQDNGSKVRRKESWNDYIFKPMTDEMKAYYNSTQSCKNFDVAQLQHNMPNDPRKWGILDEDLMPRPLSNKQHVRFWNVRCGNCRQNGHQRYDCSAPRKAINCYICGEKGHNESRCPKKSCLTCGKKQNTFCQTCENCRVLYCTMCNSTGHQRKYCPDLWRRYHQTTTMDSLPQDPGNVMKPRSQLQCCNCAKCGHESSTCKEYRWSQHFPTPAAVTSYTWGRKYRLNDTSVSSPEQYAQEANVFLSTEMRNGLVPHGSMNVQQETIQHSKFSANARVLSVFENEMTYGQEAMSFPEEEKTLEIASTVHNKKNETKEIDFYHVTYHYSKLRNKNNEKMQIMLKNLSDLIRTAEASIYVKETISSLAKGEVTPDFFKALTDKEIELEVTIGFKIPENSNLMLQIKALQKNLQGIYKLFLYWINLPNDEKNYGIDVTLPTNLTKMYNLLNSRRQQLEKQKFKSYKEFIETHSQNLLHLIKYEKKQLIQHYGTKKEYRRLRTKLWRLQIKLLMIVNTEPKANDYVYKYYAILNNLKRSRKVIDVLDNVTFLRLILLYNNLFIPHTPINAEQTIDRIMKEAQINKMNDQQVAMYTLQAQQEICNHTIQPFYADVNLPSESSTFHMPQDNFIEDSSIINIQQTAPIDVSSRNDVNVLPNTNDSTNHICDDEIIITYVSDQIENIQPTAPTNIQKKQKKEETKKRKKEKIELKISDSVKILNLIKKARAFKLPYMLQAADKLEKSKNKGMLRKKHVNALTKLIELEKKHQKNVNSYCKSLGK